jgi:hypothetical protein
MTQADALLTNVSLLEYQPDEGTYRMTVDPWTFFNENWNHYYPGCSDRDYHGQPTPHAGGSGVLVGQDLVLTVAHLLGSPPSTENCHQYMRVVFGYGDFYANQWQMTCASGNCWVTIPAANVYECESAVITDAYPSEDWAVVTLDRNVTGVTPLEIRRNSSPPTAHTPISIVGHPNHIPMKVEQGADFREASGVYYADHAHVLLNSSGSMAVDEGTGEVVGVVYYGNGLLMPGCDISPTCYREWFTYQNANAEMTPAYLAAAAIP